MARPSAARRAWAVDAMAIDPTDRILEVGALFVFAQPPSWEPGQARALAEMLCAPLTEHGFAVDDALVSDGRPVPAVGVRARAPSEAA
jgi:hypothetical protein